MKTLSAWLEVLEQRHPSTIDLGLERIGVVAERLQANTFSAPVITVAGTNGKGSTVATLVAIAVAAGWRVLSYTSPHLLHFNERICCNGEAISDEQMVTALDAVDAVRGDISLTYFEHTTLAAFWWFQRQQADLIILEVGLGGRLDAVNLIDADVAVITSIGLDHQDWLGHTLPEIAREKAGILRPGRPVVFGEREPEAILLTLAKALAAPTWVKGHDYDFALCTDNGLDGVATHSWQWSAKLAKNSAEAKKSVVTDSTLVKASAPFDCVYSLLPTPIVACENAATAIAALHVLSQVSNLQISADAIRRGLAAVRIMGRAQKIASAPEVWLDVGHNPQGVAFLWQQLPAPRAGQQTHLVIAMLADKDIDAVIACCTPYVSHWWPASLAGPRASSAERIASLLVARGLHAEALYDDVLSAYEGARQSASANDRIVVLGSFLTVSAVLAAR